MASSRGTTSSQIQNSEENQRKRKRMQSNRESARRSRLKKQKHLDDLTAQICRISKENDRISNAIDVSRRQFVKMEAENSVLRAQMNELSQRLQSLDGILNCVNAAAVAAGGGGGSCVFEAEEFQGFGEGYNWNLMGANNQQPIMASAEMFDCY